MVTFELLLHAALVADENWGDVLEPACTFSSITNHLTTRNILSDQYKKTRLYRYQVRSRFSMLMWVFAFCCLLTSTCDRCKRDKEEPKAFSDDNDMYTGDARPQLQGLTKMEEMFFARACAIMRVYRLKGGQRGFGGYV